MKTKPRPNRKLSQFQATADKKKAYVRKLLKKGVSERNIKFKIRMEFGSAVSSSTISTIRQALEAGEDGAEEAEGDPTDPEDGAHGSLSDPSYDPSQIEALLTEVERLRAVGADLQAKLADHQTGVDQLFSLFVAFKTEIQKEKLVSKAAFIRLVKETLDFALLDTIRGGSH
jgi:hypothetical protein